MKIALVHDWLVTMRGGENVVEALCEIFPDADLYTIYCQKDKISAPIRNMKIIPSFIQRMPMAADHFRWYLPLFPAAVESFKMTGYDLIISTSHCAAKGIRPAGARHICYCHSPMRYVWDFQDEYLGGLKANWLTAPLAGSLVSYLKDWDLRSNSRVGQFVANSKHIADKIQRYYKREAAVIYPPVDTEFYDVDPAQAQGDYFLLVSSLVPYKKVGLAVEAFNRMGRHLKIVGTGPLWYSLKTQARGNVEFLGKVDRETLRRLYQGCQALIFNQQEDFGIAALEAQACGRPVIAFGAGGALETVNNGQTGILFSAQTVEALTGAIERFDTRNFDGGMIRSHALTFNNKDGFKDKFRRFVERAFNETPV